MLISNYIPPAHNQNELAKVIRDMQNDSLAKHKQANNFNELGAVIVQQGVDDKLRSRGWPVGTRPPEAEIATEKKLI